jgi:hypothetical protein
VPPVVLTPKLTIAPEQIGDTGDTLIEVTVGWLVDVNPNPADEQVTSTCVSETE